MADPDDTSDAALRLRSSRKAGCCGARPAGDEVGGIHFRLSAPSPFDTLLRLSLWLIGSLVPQEAPVLGIHIHQKNADVS